MTVRLVGRTSAWTANRVRDGALEADVVVLPIDDERLDVRPLVRDEVLYVSADPQRTRTPVTVDQLASAPPSLRRRIARHRPDPPPLAERAQADGVRLRRRVEVEVMDLALWLVAAGTGDTYVRSAYTHVPWSGRG